MFKYFMLPLTIAVVLASCDEEKVYVTAEPEIYTVSGNVMQMETEIAVEGAVVAIDASIDTVATDGSFTFSGIEEGVHRLRITHPEYTAIDTIITVDADMDDMYYLTMPGFTIDGSVNIVWDGILYPVENAEVELQEYSAVSSECTVVTGADGLFRFDNVKPRFRAFSVKHTTDKYNNTYSASLDFQADTTMVITLDPLPEDYFPLEAGNKWTYKYSSFKTVRHPNAYEEKDGTLTLKIVSSDNALGTTTYHCISIFSGTLHTTDLDNQIDDTVTVDADTTNHDIIEMKGQVYLDRNIFCDGIATGSYLVFGREYPYIFPEMLDKQSQAGDLYNIKRDTGITQYTYDTFGHTRRYFELNLLSSDLSSD